MRDFEIDSNKDIVIDSRDVRTISDSDEIAQRVLTTLRTRLMEFEPAVTLGLSQNNLYGKYSNVDFAKQDIQDAIEEQVADVANIEKIKMEPDYATREMNVEITFTTRTGLEQTVAANVGGDN